MADSMASLQRQIGSVADLRSVVRAMKAQAAASVGQYEKSVAALGDYARTVDLGLAVCFQQGVSMSMPAPSHPVPSDRIIRAIVFGSDQGLVGRFNDIVLGYAQQSLEGLDGSASVWGVGDRLRAALASSGMPLLGVFPVPGSVQAIAALVGQILVSVIDESEPLEHFGSVTELHLYYNCPTSGSAYATVGQRLLPLDAEWRRNLASQRALTGPLPDVLGNTALTLRALIREYLFVSIFRACAESLASENSSRLAAMERADRNIDKMLVTLHDNFHRLRQNTIDEELSDVVSGFKALHSKK